MAQDTERVALAKVDIATREDTLMRSILQQTATGIFPANIATGTGLNWRSIMTNALNQVAATSYVDPNEVATLNLGQGVIPANMGDPDDGSSALAIVQGYDSNGTPLGGTTGVANLVGSSSGAPYNSTVEPPEVVWVSNPNISATTAVTNPQQFLLGSQMSSTGTATSISPSGRWGIVLYPNIRFGFMRPDDNMIARRVWWRVPRNKQQFELL